MQNFDSAKIGLAAAKVKDALATAMERLEINDYGGEEAEHLEAIADGEAAFRNDIVPILTEAPAMLAALHKAADALEGDIFTDADECAASVANARAVHGELRSIIARIDGAAPAPTAPAPVAADAFAAHALDTLKDCEAWFANGGDVDGVFFDDATMLDRVRESLALATPTAQPAGLWRIVSGEPDTDRALYWSNATGWGGLAGSDGYSQSERESLNLPMGGEWWFDADECESPALDPDPDQWPGGDLTGHPGYDPAPTASAAEPTAQPVGDDPAITAAANLSRAGLVEAAGEALALQTPISEAGDRCASCGAEEGESHGAQCEARGFAMGADARRLDTGALRSVTGDDADWLEATASRDGGEC